MAAARPIQQFKAHLLVPGWKTGHVECLGGAGVNEHMMISKVERASSITLISVCASAAGRQLILSPSSLFESIASTMDGSSCGANMRLIKRSQATVSQLQNQCPQLGGDEDIPLSDP